jgi:signal transduction histidine kinase
VLHEFLTASTPEIIARTRAKAAARMLPILTEDELKHGVPLFLSQLIDRLRLATTDSRAIERGATLHGGELLAMGFTVSQVVHGYGDICQVVTALAVETEAPITTHEFHTFNRCLDDAIAHAVTEYERQRDASVAFAGTESLGALAHELRNRLSAAMLAFDMLQDGTVGIHGSTGALLHRNLKAMRNIITNSITTVRLESGLGEARRISLSELLGEVEVEASLEARAGGFGLAVDHVEAGIDVEVDPQILSSAIANLIQNAFKFSRTHGHVSVRTRATADRISIDVEDECGGLPPGRSEELFQAFQQRGSNRKGLGLGLAISRKGVEAMGGSIAVQDLPGKGCVFSIELPRLPPLPLPA